MKTPLTTLCALSLAIAWPALAEPAKHPGAARTAKPSAQANTPHSDNAVARDDSAIKVKTAPADAYTCSGGTCETQARGSNTPTPPKSSYTCSGGTCE
jgi:hypothetical protein